MSKSRIVFVVGHSHWGKSQTLRELTAGNHRVRRTAIDRSEFFIRRMSNDDRLREYLRRMGSLDPASWPYVIAALCPRFDGANSIEDLLDELRTRGYRLFFWVIEQQYGKPENSVSSGEMQELRRFGRVEVLVGQHEAASRAKKLKAFIRAEVL